MLLFLSCCYFLILHERENKPLKDKNTWLWDVKVPRIFNFIESRAKMGTIDKIKRPKKSNCLFVTDQSPPQESGFSCLWNENIQLQPRYCYNLLSNEVFNYFSICSIALQIRASQQSITANLWPLTTHFCHVMVIVTGGFPRNPFIIIIFIS